MEVALHDGIQPVNSIGVVLMLRNNEKWIRKYLLTGVFDRVQKLYPTCEFVYYVCENDSTDDTPNLIHTFMEGRKGHIFTGHIDHPFDESATEWRYERIGRLAFIRNHFMAKIKTTETFQDHQWMLFIDSDLYFDELVLKTLFAHQPSKHNIGVLTCKSLEMYNTKEIEEVYTAKHYYDTFAFVDINDHLSYPVCVMHDCEMCTKDRHPKTTLITDEDKLVDVRSAWAGFALVDATVFQHDGVKWRTIRMKNELSTCEHIYFCDMITAITGKRIVVCTDAECYLLINVGQDEFRDIHSTE